LTLVCSGLSAASPAPDFRLRDWLGHDWQREPVTFSLTAAQARQAKSGQALRGANGTAIPYQLIYGATAHDLRIAFQTDLPAYAVREFRLAPGTANRTTDLRIVETADAVELTNAQTGIRLAKTLAADRGPISAVRLPSGAWVGGSRVITKTPVTAYAVKILARGPVYAEVVCQAAFGPTATWSLRIRLYAGEPVVLIDEASAIDGPAVTFSLDLQRQLNPDTLLYRSGMSTGETYYGRNCTWTLAPGEVYRLEPWLRWQESMRQGNYFGLYHDGSDDLLAVAAREAGAWVDPSVPAEKRAWHRQSVQCDAQGVHLDFPLKVGRRKWMYMTLPAEPCLVEARDPKPNAASPLPYRYLIKYGHFPLDMVKEYVLEWDASAETHPRMLITKPMLERYLAPMQGHPYSMEKALQYARECIHVFLNQGGLPYGSAPHMQSRVVIEALMFADTALRDGEGTPEERQRLRAQLAFVGYAISRPEYWSPERGYAGTANMTTMVAAYRLAAGSLLSSHPRAADWRKAGMTELVRQMHEWSDDNGGWLEAPHYAMVSYDFILGGLLMAYNSSGDETLFSPKMRRIIEWFAKISTPPDARTGGFRHLPPIGNTWLFEPTGEFGIFATLWKERDPQFAAEMQWMWQQHRSATYAGIGGSGHSTGGYRSVLYDATLPAKAPAYGSELFPKTGVILRSGFPTDRETQLYLIAGTNHDHYDYDSGSITLWGKGRIVADDFGYFGQAPMHDHSMVESPITGGIMQIERFAPAPQADYVRGVAGGWTRQILFIKDADPLAPNYFIMADSLKEPVAATWRLWCTAQAVRLSPQQALIVGTEDVDTDLFFLQPPGMALTTEDYSVKTFGLGADGYPGMQTLTQTGVIATLPDGAAVSAVLYPRLKTEAAPRITALAGGKGVKVEHLRGTDYVFLAAAPFTYADGDTTFTGTAGVIQIRDGQATLILPAPGQLAADGQRMTKE